ncbi:MAG TPA: hypothetical protein VGC81_18390 [Candidatus Methylomirabilis sp.]
MKRVAWVLIGVALLSACSEGERRYELRLADRRPYLIDRDKGCVWTLASQEEGFRPLPVMGLHDRDPERVPEAKAFREKPITEQPRGKPLTEDQREELRRLYAELATPPTEFFPVKGCP